MKEALDIVIKLIDSGKVNGGDAVTLIQAILNNRNQSVNPSPFNPSPLTWPPTQIEYQPKPIECRDNSGDHNPYSNTITTTIDNINNDNINNDKIEAIRPKGMEVIYG